MAIADTSLSAATAQTEAQQALPGEERLLLALEMSALTRELARARIRDEHPEWSPLQVGHELIRIAFLPDAPPARLR